MMNINVPTPELDKMRAVFDRSQAIGEFLDMFLGSKGWVIAEVPDYYEQTLVPVSYRLEEVLAEFFGIDLDKVEQERRALIDAIRRYNDQQEREKADAEDACSASPSSPDSQS